MGGDDDSHDEGPDLSERQRDGDGNGDRVEWFDISLAAAHSYMGESLEAVRGCSVVEAGWRGRVPALAHTGAVFPGETVPLVLTDARDAALLQHAVDTDKLFGLLCPDEAGEQLSGWGVLCEVSEVGQARDEPALLCKARATQRFRIADPEQARAPVRHYTNMKLLDVQVMPERSSTDPLQPIRLNSLDALRRGQIDADRRLRRLDAAQTPWPQFVSDMCDYRRLRDQLHDFFKLESMPEEPVPLSFWVASNLTLSPRHRLALLEADHALQRLHLAVRLLHRKSLLQCVACLQQIAPCDSMFAMSSAGVHSNYTNLGGYMHDVLTVSAAPGVLLSGAPSADYSWFPGYSWTVAQCARCGSHVGWRFDALKRTLRPATFFGVCRNRVQPLRLVGGTLLDHDHDD